MRKHTELYSDDFPYSQEPSRGEYIDLYDTVDEVFAEAGDALFNVLTPQTPDEDADTIHWMIRGVSIMARPGSANRAFLEFLSESALAHAA
ncbi:MAG: hypothetical protein KZQ93_16010 [Candidatus Thiodiazotropha sp. (ex Monitilora ramsayi)]|nr:hypothetical protein [Candidatus Thiodiazotropha sp. (ex Monitilora ramsayi)]